MPIKYSDHANDLDIVPTLEPNTVYIYHPGDEDDEEEFDPTPFFHFEPISFDLTMTDPEIIQSLRDLLDRHTTYTVPAIDRVFINPEKRTTTIRWVDGETTTVRCAEGETFSEWGGFLAAVVKRLFGSSTKASKMLEKKKTVCVKKKKKKPQENTVDMPPWEESAHA